MFVELVGALTIGRSGNTEKSFNYEIGVSLAMYVN